MSVYHSILSVSIFLPLSSGSLKQKLVSTKYYKIDQKDYKSITCFCFIL